LLPDLKGHQLDVVVASLGDDSLAYSLKVADALRQQGLAVVHAGGGAAKRQFKIADREKSRFVVVIGEDEVAKDGLMLKDLATGKQDFYVLDDAIQVLSGVGMIE